ncbi:hypothetical protein GCM10023085_46000 [Actinomadura viridis]|uniref:Uncharacterized protein n=1 Tax=Actinomadura viridis TaxID=58110 RepID=A0A931GK91_9ACTN|nr:hypothetical protein [Actinomadura viridis]MBG6089960.1 hypothetical protein [Actinomadura viridis]
MNPFTIAEQLGKLGVDLDKAKDDLGRLENEAIEAEGAFRVKYSKIFRGAAGSVEDRKQIAIFECDEEWRIWGKAAALVRLQKEHIRALHARIDVGRTLASTARAEASLAQSGWSP